MKEFESLSALKKHLKNKKSVSNIAIQSLDLTLLKAKILKIKFDRCLLLGCVISDDLWHHLYDNNSIFPTLDVPYNAYPQPIVR
ncbi:MAG: hypothetical protein ACI9XO_001771 [Paraglaciecola sp.]|jgi:hypothetical protein